MKIYNGIKAEYDYFKRIFTKIKACKCDYDIFELVENESFFEGLDPFIFTFEGAVCTFKSVEGDRVYTVFVEYFEYSMLDKILKGLDPKNFITEKTKPKKVTACRLPKRDYMHAFDYLNNKILVLAEIDRHMNAVFDKDFKASEKFYKVESKMLDDLNMYKEWVEGTTDQYWADKVKIEFCETHPVLKFISIHFLGIDDVSGQQLKACHNLERLGLLDVTIKQYKKFGSLTDFLDLIDFITYSNVEDHITDLAKRKTRFIEGVRHLEYKNKLKRYEKNQLSAAADQVAEIDKKIKLLRIFKSVKDENS